MQDTEEREPIMRSCPVGSFPAGGIFAPGNERYGATLARSRGLRRTCGLSLLAPSFCRDTL
ncbi:hypothetical protein SRM_00779 [Salinibacter ruber M8]|uniref:Uncharacterized protein n=1 Tax=Salinibacter ruber (strain M8) TaxID=761659 RepID=D5H6P5_SALRM|nr:hypothetical protein SRM_00779 [Salinibacter ruber M8]